MFARTATGNVLMTNWADYSPPFHPHFEEECAIADKARKIKAEINCYLIEGVGLLFGPRTDALFDFRDENIRLCWTLALSAQKYGVIYFISRADAAQIDEPFVEKYRNTILQIESLIKTDSNFNRLFNYAVHRYVRSDRRTVSFSEQLVPVNAISSLAEDEICVRFQDFFASTSEQMLQVGIPLYDLHDFAHQLSSTLCHTIYGSRYFDLLVRLPKRLRMLVGSKGLRTSNAIQFSDGLVFSELLLGVYERLDYEAMSPDELIDELAELGVGYFLDGKALPHLSTGKEMSSENPITVEELAALAQNKFYELPASEIEQKLFTRGGVDHRDTLAAMDTIQIIEFLATNPRKWLYYEKRNTVRHRAHLEIYRRAAIRLLNAPVPEDDRELLTLLVAKARYRPYLEGDDQNIWNLLRYRLGDVEQCSSLTRRC